MPGFQLPVPPKDSGLTSSDKSSSCSPEKPNAISYPKDLTPLNNVESIRSYRWLFEVLVPYGPNAQNANKELAALAPGNLLIYLKKAERPSLEFDEIPIHNGPRVIYRPGKFKCNPINLEFYEIMLPNGEDKVSPNAVALRTYEWMRKIIYITKQSVYSSYKDYTFDGNLVLLNGEGIIVHKYKLYGCFPMKVTPSEINYESDTLTSITVSLRYNDFQELGPKEKA